MNIIKHFLNTFAYKQNLQVKIFNKLKLNCSDRLLSTIFVVIVRSLRILCITLLILESVSTCWSPNCSQNSFYLFKQFFLLKKLSTLFWGKQHVNIYSYAHF